MSGTRIDQDGIGIDAERRGYPPWTAEVVCDSIARAERLTTMVLCFPNAIHQEILRHGGGFAFSVESQRAVPAQECAARVARDGPYIPPPLARSGSMQGLRGLLSDRSGWEAVWLEARADATRRHSEAIQAGAHKSIANRLLAPFVWTRAVVTGCDWAWRHFFSLRCHQAADVGIQAVASRALCAWLASEPVERSLHIPFDPGEESGLGPDKRMDVSAARCATISYGGIRSRDVYGSLKMAENLWEEGHASPFEHQGWGPDYSDRFDPESLSGRFMSKVWAQQRKCLEREMGAWKGRDPHEIAELYGDADAILPDGTRLKIGGTTLVEVKR